MVKVTQNSFLGGQLDFEMMGRQDFQKYNKGASKLCNFNILKRGGIEKRNGFDRLKKLSDIGIGRDATTRIVPFAYDKNSGFVLLFTDSGCFAFGTAKRVGLRHFEVKTSEDVSGFSKEEINEFDYCQCGYRMFIAHPNHPPSEIVLNPAGLADNSITAFTWKNLDISVNSDSIPAITGVEQERQAPKADTAGGTFTEYYKVSATFNDEESMPSEEYFNTDCVEPVSLGTDADGKQIIQKTSMESNSKGTQSTTTITVANVTGKCKGTKYYLPWVDNQSIKLKIKAAKNKDGAYPERVNIYKKKGGVYGLIGTAAVEPSGDVKISSTGALYGDATEITSHSLNSIDFTSIDEPPKITDSYLFAPSKNAPKGYGAYVKGYRLSYGNSITYNIPSTAISPSEKITARIFLGKLAAEITSNKDLDSDNPGTEPPETDAGEATGYIYPTAAKFTYYPNKASKITVKFGNEEKVFTCNADGSGKGQVYKPSSGATEFENNASKKLTEFINAISKTITGDTYADVSFTPEKDMSVDSISIKSSDTGKDLVFTGAYIYKTTASSEDSLVFVDKNITPETDKTPIDSSFSPPFTKDGDYPSTVCVAQQRLIFASSKNHPETIWMSAIGEFNNFIEREVQTTDDAIQFNLPVTRFAKLNHIIEMKSIVAFNAACEWVIESVSATQGITYETIVARPQSYSGSNQRLKPVICNNSILFSERTGQAVRRLSYDFANDGYAGRDVSILSYSIFNENPIVDWTYQQHPFSSLWCVLADGSLACFTFMEEQDVLAWSTHKHACGKIVSIATSHAIAPGLKDIPYAKGYDSCCNEEVYAIVDNGKDLYLERMRPLCKDEDTVFNSLCLDGMETFEYDAKIPYESGFTYVNLDTGKAMALEGYRDGDTINGSGTRLAKGKKIESEFVSVYPSVGNTAGNGQFDIKGIVNVGLRLKGSEGGRVKHALYDGKGEAINYGNDGYTISGGTVKTKPHDASNIKPIGSNNRDGRISITHDGIYKFGVLSMEIDYATEENGR